MPAFALGLKSIIIITDPAFPRLDAILDIGGRTEIPEYVVGGDLLFPLLCGAVFGAITVWLGRRLFYDVADWRRRQ